MASDYGLSYTDIQPLLPNFTIAVSSKPTTLEVNAFIERREAHLHGILRAIEISTPLTDAEDVDLVKEFIIQISAYDTWTRAFQYQNTPDDVVAWRDDWKEFLADIKMKRYSFASDTTPEGEDYPAFGVIRPIPRDPIYTDKYGTTRYDE